MPELPEYMSSANGVRVSSGENVSVDPSGSVTVPKVMTGWSVAPSFWVSRIIPAAGLAVPTGEDSQVAIFAVAPVPRTMAPRRPPSASLVSAVGSCMAAWKMPEMTGATWTAWLANGVIVIEGLPDPGGPAGVLAGTWGSAG